MLSIHAHPDDESSKGAATTAKYTDNGAHATLVCATGGEEGDILNEAVNTPEVIADLFNVRMAELKAATDIIGYDVVEMLGYRDSGMKNGEANNHPDCFWAAPIEESATRFAAMLRTHRPHIVISYGDPMGGYDHPDHVRVWEITQPAIDMAADPAADLDGEPWQVLKLYNSMWSKERMIATHEKYEELGLKSPFDERWLGRPGHDHLITTRIEAEAWYQRRNDALLSPRDPGRSNLAILVRVAGRCHGVVEQGRVFRARLVQGRRPRARDRPVRWYRGGKPWLISGARNGSLR